MGHQFVYTSAASGLKAGSQGYCMVAATQGLPQNLASQLESLSGYKHLFKPNDPNNPVGYSHVVLRVSGKLYHVVSRVADAGLDYTNRSNLLAHHIAVEGSTPDGGPAWMLGPEQRNFFTEWSGDPRQLSPFQVRPGGDRAAVCTAWKAESGYAGWGGVLAESALSAVPGKVAIIYPPGLDMLPLLRESMALLPANVRWRVNFNTYFTQLLPGQECHWRCIPAVAPQAKKLSGMTVIDLTKRSVPSAGAGKDAAERGMQLGSAPVKVTPSGPHPAGKRPVGREAEPVGAVVAKSGDPRRDPAVAPPVVPTASGVAPPKRSPPRRGRGDDDLWSGKGAGDSGVDLRSRSVKKTSKNKTNLWYAIFVFACLVVPTVAGLIGGAVVFFPKSMPGYKQLQIKSVLLEKLPVEPDKIVLDLVRKKSKKIILVFNKSLSDKEVKELLPTKFHPKRNPDEPGNENEIEFIIPQTLRENEKIDVKTILDVDGVDGKLTSVGKIALEFRKPERGPITSEDELGAQKRQGNQSQKAEKPVGPKSILIEKISGDGTLVPPNGIENEWVLKLKEDCELQRLELVMEPNDQHYYFEEPSYDKDRYETFELDVDSKKEFILKIQPKRNEHNRGSPGAVELFTSRYASDAEPKRLGLLRIEIEPVSDPLIIESPSEESESVKLEVGKEWNLQMQATDPDDAENQNFHWEILPADGESEMPVGLLIDEEGGGITWQPTLEDIGKLAFKVKVTRAEGNPGVSERKISISVKLANLGLESESFGQISRNHDTYSLITDLPRFLKLETQNLTLRLHPKSRYEIQSRENGNLIGSGSDDISTIIASSKDKEKFPLPFKNTRAYWEITDSKSNNQTAVAHLYHTVDEAKEELKIKIGVIKNPRDKQKLFATLGMLKLQVELEGKPELEPGEIKLKVEGYPIVDWMKVLEGKPTVASYWPQVENELDWFVELPSMVSVSKNLEIGEPRRTEDGWEANVETKFGDRFDFKSKMVWKHSKLKSGREPSDRREKSDQIQINMQDVRFNEKKFQGEGVGNVDSLLVRYKERKNQLENHITDAKKKMQNNINAISSLTNRMTIIKNRPGNEKQRKEELQELGGKKGTHQQRLKEIRNTINPKIREKEQIKESLENLNERKNALKSELSKIKFKYIFELKNSLAIKSPSVQDGGNKVSNGQ